MQQSTKPLPLHITDFLDWLDVQKGLSSKTQENYSRFLNKFIIFLKINNLDKLKPHELTSEHIWSYQVYLARFASAKSPGQASPKKGLSKATQNYYLIALRSLLNYFAERDIVSLPAEKVKLARQKDEKPVRFLSLEQLKKLFEAPDTSKPAGLRDRAILETFFSTGMRISELVSLNREQIKFPDGDQDLELVIIGKGSKARTIYISQRALYWLKKYLDSREDNDKCLFVNYRSKKDSPMRLTPRSIEEIIKKYVIETGLPLNTTPHVMRHSFATDLLSQGVDIRILQEFLGHKSITATQIYTHVTSKKLREVHQKFHSLG